jgi:hypothetical protein
MYELQEIEHKIKKLSKSELDNLGRFLDEIIKNQSILYHKKGKLSQIWAGKLNIDDMNSLQLQKKALEWR